MYDDCRCLINVDEYVWPIDAGERLAGGRPRLWKHTAQQL